MKILLYILFFFCSSYSLFSQTTNEYTPIILTNAGIYSEFYPRYLTNFTSSPRLTYKMLHEHTKNLEVLNNFYDQFLRTQTNAISTYKITINTNNLNDTYDIFIDDKNEIILPEKGDFIWKESLKSEPIRKPHFLLCYREWGTKGISKADIYLVTKGYTYYYINFETIESLEQYMLEEIKHNSENIDVVGVYNLRKMKELPFYRWIDIDIKTAKKVGRHKFRTYDFIDLKERPKKQNKNNK